MKTILTTLALAGALVVPAAAQKMGSANRGAPTCEQSIEFDNGTELELSYTSLNYADGAFMKNLKNEQFRNMVNNNAKQNPVGKFEVGANCEIGGKKIAKGDYGVHFLIGEEGNFIFTLSHEGEDGPELIQWPLDLKKTDRMRKRLTLTLMAGEGNDDAVLHMHFGNLMIDVPVKTMKQDG